MHELANGKNQTFEVEAYTPPDLTDGMEIGGIINGADGAPLCWSGRAGLSATLPERFNAVHVAFGHRVIEATRDPFQGKSVPTLYAEVELDRECPWKYCLSDHKTKVVKYRDELIESIYKQIEPLLLKSEHQAHNLALREMTAPITSPVLAPRRGTPPPRTGHWWTRMSAGTPPGRRTWPPPRSGPCSPWPPGPRSSRWPAAHLMWPRSRSMSSAT